MVKLQTNNNISLYANNAKEKLERGEGDKALWMLRRLAPAEDCNYLVGSERDILNTKCRGLYSYFITSFDLKPVSIK